MNRPLIIIDDRIPYIKGLLEDVADVRYLPYGEMTHHRVMEADALVVRTRTCCDRALLEGTRVRIVVTATIGMDHIDMEYCEANGITVRNAPGCNAGSVAQWVEMVIDRLIVDKLIDDKLVNGDWLGIVGLGHVGTRVKEVAERHGFRVMVSDPPKGQMTTLSEIARRCGVITFHTPLTVEGRWATKGMASDGFFAQVRPDALIINAARGGIVDEKSLKRWLRSHPEGRCAIDCWEGEPDIDMELLEMAAIGTPHIAGYSADGKWNGTRMAVEAINGFFGIEGRMPTPLPDPESHFYDILRDSNALKHEPGKFEWFRGHYPERRE